MLMIITTITGILLMALASYLTWETVAWLLARRRWRQAQARLLRLCKPFTPTATPTARRS